MNTEKEYDLVVYIGRFQPFHVAHQKTIERAFELSDHVQVLVGSARGAADIRNPWTYEERKYFISTAFPREFYQSGGMDLQISPSRDFTYDDNAWIADIGKLVGDHARAINAEKIAIIGHDKDSSSFYLNYFQWDPIDMPAYPPEGDTIDATKVRRLMFERNYHFVKGVLPENVYNYLFEVDIANDTVPWIHTPQGELMFAEWEHNKEEAAKWAGSPYPVQFVTADAVVLQSGCILLVKRAGFPGFGQWAMPGGFVEHDERIRKAVIRELYEETRIKVPANVLDRAIDAYEMFDDPYRSTRGRTITHTYKMTLDPTQKLPKVKGDGSETFEAKWFTLAEFREMEDVMFEDHFHVINHMLAQPTQAVRK